MDEEAITFERLACEALCVVVGTLELGLDLVDHKFVFVGPEPVPGDEEISSAVGKSISVGEIERALIVFKYSCSNT